MSVSIRARLQLSIVALVLAVAVALSVLYLSAIVNDSFREAQNVAGIYADQVETFIIRLTEAKTADAAPGDPSDPIELYVGFVENDPDLTALLQSLVGNARVIVEGLVTGPEDRVLVASIPAKQGQKHTSLPLLAEFDRKRLWEQVVEVFSGSQDYEVVRQIGVNNETLFTVRMVVSSVLLRDELRPSVESLARISLGALVLSLLAAVIVSRLAVSPYARIAEMIDHIASGEAREPPRSGGGARELAVVESKLNLLGKQYRGAQADADQLRTNIDSLLTRMQEAVFLFDSDDRLLVAGGSAERIMGRSREEMMGRAIGEIFPDSTEMGVTIQGAVGLRRGVKDRQVLYEPAGRDPVRLIADVELVEEFPGPQRVGALVTLREAEPRRQIESQLDVSTRLAAISQLTKGAAHEIKNPLNAITLHLEVLKQKLESAQVGTEEIEVISREIRRLDRVVKSFLDFTRPVELDVQPLDLNKLVDEALSLIRPDAEKQKVMMIIGGAQSNAWIQGDRDLLKQALLNVLVNALQAMPEGGELRVSVEPDGGDWVIRVADSGAGIAEQARDKVFQLYFTTKGEGSGIGLAMTFQVVQLHGGTIEFTSELGEGTEFRLQFPAAERVRSDSAEAPA